MRSTSSRPESAAERRAAGRPGFQDWNVGGLTRSTKERKEGQIEPLGERIREVLLPLLAGVRTGLALHNDRAHRRRRVCPGLHRQRQIEILVYLLCIVFMAWLTWTTSLPVVDAYATGQVAVTLSETPMWIPLFFVPF